VGRITVQHSAERAPSSLRCLASRNLNKIGVLRAKKQGLEVVAGTGISREWRKQLTQYLVPYMFSFLSYFGISFLLTSRPKHTQDLVFVLFVIVVVIIVIFSFSFFFSFLGKMTRWRNAPQNKEQEAVLTPRHLIDTDISKMSELEFKTMIIKILTGHEKKHRGH